MELEFSLFFQSRFFYPPSTWTWTFIQTTIQNRYGTVRTAVVGNTRTEFSGTGISSMSVKSLSNSVVPFAEKNSLETNIHKLTIFQCIKLFEFAFQNDAYLFRLFNFIISYMM